MAIKNHEYNMKHLAKTKNCFVKKNGVTGPGLTLSLRTTENGHTDNNNSAAYGVELLLCAEADLEGCKMV